MLEQVDALRIEVISIFHIFWFSLPRPPIILRKIIFWTSGICLLPSTIRQCYIIRESFFVIQNIPIQGEVTRLNSISLLHRWETTRFWRSFFMMSSKLFSTLWQADYATALLTFMSFSMIFKKLQEYMHTYTQAPRIHTYLYPGSKNTYILIPRLHIYTYNQAPRIHTYLYPGSKNTYILIPRLQEYIHTYTQTPRIHTYLYPGSKNTYILIPRLQEYIHTYTQAPRIHYILIPRLQEYIHTYTQAPRIHYILIPRLQEYIHTYTQAPRIHYILIPRLQEYIHTYIQAPRIHTYLYPGSKNTYILIPRLQDIWNCQLFSCFPIYYFNDCIALSLIEIHYFGFACVNCNK